MPTIHIAVQGLPPGSPLSQILFNIFVAAIPHFPKNQNIVFQYAAETTVVTSEINTDVL